MEKIIQYLAKEKKTFQEGAKLLLENVEISADYQKYFKAQLQRDEPETIAVQLLDSQLRNFLRIAEQKKTVIPQNPPKQDKPIILSPKLEKEQSEQIEEQEPVKEKKK